MKIESKISIEKTGYKYDSKRKLIKTFFIFDL